MSILLALTLMVAEPTLLAPDAKPCVKLDKHWQRKSNWGEFWYGFNHPTDLGIRSATVRSTTRINGEVFSASSRVSWADPTVNTNNIRMADFHSPEFMAQREQEYNDAKCPIPEK